MFTRKRSASKSSKALRDYYAQRERQVRAFKPKRRDFTPKHVKTLRVAKVMGGGVWQTLKTV